MRRPPLRLALLALLVVLAGCTYGAGGAAPAAPSAGSDAAATGSQATNATSGVREVSLENSSIDLPADRLFGEVEALVGEDVEAPEVRVLKGRSAGGGAFSYPHTPYGFVEDMALTDVAPGGDGAAGMTDQFGGVYLVAGNTTPTAQTKILVHEYVHVIQFRADLLPWTLSELQRNIPTDEAQTKLALTEGAAVWVTDQYIRRHMPKGTTPQSKRMAIAYEEARVGGRFFLARYYFGAQGVDRRLDDASQLRAFYEGDLPETTEQLLHGATPATEPMAPLNVTAQGGENWQVAGGEDEDRLGELFIRVALSRELSRPAAANAADGWAYDRLLEFNRGGDTAYAWVTRWDDPANASAFDAAFETYAERRNTTDSLAFRTKRLGDGVVVVYSGPQAFVDRATATMTGDGERVRVAAGG